MSDNPMSAPHQPRPIDAAATALGAIMLATAGYIWRFGPEGPLPMHFNLHGEVDRWGERTEAAGVLAGMALLMVVGHLVMSRAARDPKVVGQVRRTLNLGQGLNLAIFALVGLLIASLGLGRIPAGQDPAAKLRALMAFISFMMLVLGASVGKVAPNRWVGVRTHWNFRSRLAWDKSNRLIGRIYFWAGLAGILILPFVPQPVGIHLVTLALIGGALAAVFESWRVWRTDPDRRA